MFIFINFQDNQIVITIDFSQRGSCSLTDFLYFQLKARILDGNLTPNQKLPSKRSLASHLGVSVITVQNAYEQLIDEGYVYSAEKRGYFVTELEALSSSDSGHSQTDRRKTTAFQSEQVFFGEGDWSNKTEGSIRTGKPKENLEEACLKTIINLQDNHIHHELFPFSLWSRLMRKVLQDSKERILSPLPPQGLWELRQAIASYLKTFRNMVVDPEQIIIGAGTEYLYSLALQLLGKNLRYGVENPGYLKPSRIMGALQVQWYPLAMDGAGITPQELEEKGINVVLVSPAHHFPTGIIMPIRRRQELLAWARSGSRYIIEDDYDSEFRFTGRPLETLFSLDASSGKGQQDHVIYLNTFTKTLTPSLRISYMVLPESLVKTFHQNLGFYSCTVSSIEQLTLARFIHEGHYEKHLARKKKPLPKPAGQPAVLSEQKLLSFQNFHQRQGHGASFFDGSKHFCQLPSTTNYAEEDRYSGDLPKSILSRNPQRKRSTRFGDKLLRPQKRTDSRAGKAFGRGSKSIGNLSRRFIARRKQEEAVIPPLRIPLI